MYDDKKLAPPVVRASIVCLAAYAVIGGGVTLVGWFAILPRLTDWGRKWYFDVSQRGRGRGVFGNCVGFDDVASALVRATK